VDLARDHVEELGSELARGTHLVDVVRLQARGPARLVIISSSALLSRHRVVGVRGFGG